MATSIDKKIVEMELRNREFEARSRETMGTLDQLKAKLNFKGVGDSLNIVNRDIRRFDVSPMANGLDVVTAKFSALGIMGATVINNLTSKILDFGMQTAKSVTIKPIVDGMQEYETKLNSIQTILANTQSKGTTLPDVIKALDDLNTYSDKTIYNFAEMTRNIGTFTAAGVDLDTSTQAIKGIANLAAVSGSTSEQASTAMYQLSQAMASGAVKLMDWNSVVNAGMGGQVFQDALKETARTHGVAIDKMIKKEGSFRESLKNGWITTSVLTETLAKFTGDLSSEQLKQMGYTEKQVKEITQLGKTANDAATKVKTFTQLMDTLGEARGSGWAKTWEYIIGDFEQARNLWTAVSDVLGEGINNQAEARNKLVKEWVDLGGRDTLIKSIYQLWSNMSKVFGAVKKGFTNIFPPMTAKSLVKMTDNFSKFVSSLVPSEQLLANITKVFTSFFKVISQGINGIGQLATHIYEIFKAGDAGSGLLTAFANFGQWIIDMVSGVDVVKTLTYALTTLGEVIENLWNTITSFDFAAGFQNALNFFTSIPTQIQDVMMGITDIERKAMIGGFTAGGLGLFLKPILEAFKGRGNIQDTIKDTIGTLGDMFDNIGDSFKNFSKAIASNSLLKMAQAIALLAASLFILAMIPKDKLLAGSAAIVTLIASLTIAMKVLGGLNSLPEGTTKGSSLWSIAAALVALAAAVAVISVAAALLSFIDLPKALGGLLAVFVMIGTFVIVLDKCVTSIFTTSIALIAISIAFALLAASIIPISMLPIEKLGQGLFVMLVILLAIASFAIAMDSMQIESVSLALIGLGIALNIINIAVLGLAMIPFPFLIQGLIALALILTMLSLSIKGMQRSLVGAGALIGLGIALNLLVLPILALGTMDYYQLAQGLGSIAAMILLITAASQLLTSGIVGAVALVLLAGAILVLSAAVWVLADIPTDKLWMAVGALAAIFGILLLAAAIAVALAPGLLVLSAGLIALGLAVFLCGLGMGVFASAMGAFAAMGSAGFLVLTAGCISLASVIPYVVKQFIQGFKLILEFIVEEGQLIVDAFTTILGGILVSIPLAMGKAAEYFIDGFIDFMHVIEQQAMPLAEATVGALKAMVDAVETYWVGSDGIAMKFGELMVTLLAGISMAIREYGPQFITDMEYISGFMAEGLVRGFGSLPNQVIASLIGLKKDLFGIITGDKQNAFVAGETTANGYSDGMTNTFSARKKDIAAAMAGILPGISRDAVNATAVPMAPVVDMTQPNLVLSNYQKALTATHADAAKMEGTINTNRQIDIKVSGNVNATGGNQPATTIFNQANLQQQLMNTMKRELRWGTK